jgi:hypothetical protein
VSRLLTALREAWWTFRLSLLGWEVQGYTLPAWPGFGRCAGTLTRWQPTYPAIPARPCEHGWGLSSQGDSWPERWETPLAAVADTNSRPAKAIRRRFARIREGRA